MKNSLSIRPLINNMEDIVVSFALEVFNSVISAFVSTAKIQELHEQRTDYRKNEFSKITT